MKILLGFFGVGILMFVFVWWPIQAERALVMMGQLEKEMSEKKSHLESLVKNYQSKTSLSALDAWAQSHGPWQTPRSNDLILIQN